MELKDFWREHPSAALAFSGGARMAGVIVGAKAPIVVTSRGSGAEEKYLSLLLACMMADGERKREGEHRA